MYKNSNHSKIFLIAILYITAYCNAESGTFHSWCIERWNLLTRDIGYSGDNLLHFAKTPFEKNPSRYLTAGSLLGLVALSSLGDQPLQHESLEKHSSRLDKIIHPWQYYGAGYIPAGLAASLYIGGLGFSNDWLRETGRECMMSLSCAGLVTTCLKFSVGRERPYAKEGAFDLDPFSLRSQNTSFPSGHTTVAFAFSTILAARIRNPIVTAVLYGAACMTAVQRIYSNNHWFTDVAAGALIGTTSGLFILHDSGNSFTSANNSLPVIVPLVTTMGTGISVCKSF